MIKIKNKSKHPPPIVINFLLFLCYHSSNCVPSYSTFGVKAFVSVAPAAIIGKRGIGHHSTKSVAPLYGGGFGASSSSSAAKNKKNNKKKSSLVIEKATPTPAPITATHSDDTPILDRFGLPILTAENINPPLPPGTEIIPNADIGKECSREDLEFVLKDYVKVNLSLLDDENSDVKIRLLHRSPPVLSIDNFFTPEECQECINLTVPSSLPDNEENTGDHQSAESLQVNSATFSPLAKSKRTSTTWFCHYAQVPTLLAKARRLFHNIDDVADSIQPTQMEEPQVVRYRTGEEFSWHHDEIPQQQLDNGGQRIATLLVYLNTIENPRRGGGTVFRDLQSSNSNNDDQSSMLTMRPKKGSALLFFPARKDGSPDDRTLHKGEVLIEQQSKRRKRRGRKDTSDYDNDDQAAKMIAQLWVHERDYTPQVPLGNTHEAAVGLIQKTEDKLGYSHIYRTN